MKGSQLLSEDILLKQAIDLLMKKLGPVETSRFLSLPAKKRMESVRRHHAWQAQLHKDQFFGDVFDGK
jgi:hypothetical protein